MAYGNAYTSAIPIRLRELSQVNGIDSILTEEINEIINALNIILSEISKVTRVTVTLTEAVTPGQLVAVWLSGGVLSGRLANAANNTKQAVGFATETVAIGATTVLTLQGANLYLSGLTIGSQYYLSDTTSGAVTATKPVGAGKIVQPVGFASSATILEFFPNNNWTQL